MSSQSDLSSSLLRDLLRDFHAADSIYKPGPYWNSYQAVMVKALNSLNWSRARSGDFPVLAAFGLGDVVYFTHPFEPEPKRTVNRLLTSVAKWIVEYHDYPLLPYGARLSTLREAAFNFAEVTGIASGAKPLASIQASDFGAPADVWYVGGRRYTMNFLNYYVRYCSMQKVVPLRGDETIVELGSGSGEQIIVLKQLYPDLTFLCFDLPVPLTIAERYISGALGSEAVVSIEEGRTWSDLCGIRKGKVHFFGNWRFPLLCETSFDIFWNAASFGEMEPEIVEHYLGIVAGRARIMYLLQAAKGRKNKSVINVNREIVKADYERLLAPYRVLLLQDARTALGNMGADGGYFEGVWARTEG